MCGDVVAFVRVYVIPMSRKIGVMIVGIIGGADKRMYWDDKAERTIEATSFAIEHGELFRKCDAYIFETTIPPSIYFQKLDWRR